MQLQHVLTLATVCGTPAVLAQSLLAALQQNGFTEYATQLQGSSILTAGPDIIVYAPSNNALAGNNNGTITRRDNDSKDDRDRQNRYQVANAKARIFRPQPSGNSTQRRGLTNRAVASFGSVYETLLQDSEWANIGSGQNQTLVERSAPSASLPFVFTGLGKSVKVTGTDIPFENGVIRPIDGLFTLPRNLSYTLQYLGQNKLMAALQKAGLLPDLDNRPGITILAPNNAAFNLPSSLTNAQLAQVLKEHIIINLPVYTPWLEDGQTFQTLGRTTITISVKDSVTYINGARILAGDTIIKNGVVHTIDKLLSNTPALVTTSGATMDKPFSLVALTFAFIGLGIVIPYWFS